ncbi:MAG: 4Fe-4S binding protein [Spirochaetia bacterium]|nr:4Fe-4S binding protein [Spirochaetia bacterium]
MDDRSAYAALRRKLDTLPVGYPKGKAGLRILRRLFTPEEAGIALFMDWRFSDSPAIARAMAAAGRTVPADLRGALGGMASKGAILGRPGTDSWALQPFVVGMYELQVASLAREGVEDATSFLKEGFALELLASGEHQTRVIPVGAAIRSEHRVASHEEFRELIKAADGRIAVLPCVCRKGADLSGHPCKATDRRELCIVFRDYADTVVREGWGRGIGVDEALAIAAENEREGLVMRPSNEREPQFLCACCGDCCGLFAVVKAMRRPADFVSSNFRARVDPEACVSCGACARRCPMDAVQLKGAKARAVPAFRARRSGAAAAKPKARVVPARCVGCGVCVAACAFGAVTLERKSATVPPADTAELLERLAATRPGAVRKLWTGLRGILGIPVRDMGNRTPGPGGRS